MKAGDLLQLWDLNDVLGGVLAFLFDMLLKYKTQCVYIDIAL